MQTRPFSMRLFCPSGKPDGVLIASRDDWPGRAVIFPRILLGEIKGRKEYLQPGVYILFGKDKMYIGEGDPVGHRIDSHANNKEFWRKGVFFTAEGGRINKAHVQHLEARLIALAKATGRVELDNANQPTVPALSEEENSFAENFLHEILLMLPLLGFWQFTASDVDADKAEDDESEELEASSVSTGKRSAMYSRIPTGLTFKLHSRGGANATLETVNGGVIVKADSLVSDPANARFELDSPSYAAQRRQLCDSGVIDRTPLAFTKDQFFSSGSTAAAVVRGASSNADWWKNENGKSLGDYIRELKANS